MCGIAGFFNKSENWKENIIRMNNRMIHRGPDSQEYWANNDCSVVLGHVRLSILDLSQAGSQPMVSHNGRYVMVLNGEIYNYKILEKKLLNEKIVRSFRGHSDTEVLLEYIAAYGFEQALKDSVGMFACGVYDQKERTLKLGRDRIGEKPLYYGFINKAFVFASEIGAIREFAQGNLEINRDALTLYFRHAYIPAPYTVYQGVYKLEAGCILDFSNACTVPRIYKYWDLLQVASEGLASRFSGSENDAVDELELLLKRAIKSQMVADVPVGAFLSGGIDSSTVVAIMQSLSDKQIKTFSIGFCEDKYNEAPYAKNTAEYLGTEHTELYISSKDMINVIPKIPYIYGEPFADSSQIPTYFVSKLAREKVTVSLSGDGGDELFCGYETYASIQNIWNKIKYIPMPVRKFARNGLQISRLSETERFRFVSAYMDAKGVEDIYVRSMIENSKTDKLVLGGYVPDYRYTSYPFDYLHKEGVENLMLMDVLVYHPDDILVKVDRSAMAVSLESRVPFLDKDIIKFAFSLPHQYKADRTIGKKVLRNVLYRYVPKQMMDRPKKGFAIPVCQWIRDGELKGWAEDLLSSGRIKRQGFLNPAMVSKMWDMFKENGINGTIIWNILMFQDWLESEKN